MTVWEYVYIAMGTGAVGAIATFALVLICGYLDINIVDHVWLLALPLMVALIINISAIELYRRHRGK